MGQLFVNFENANFAHIFSDSERPLSTNQEIIGGWIRRKASVLAALLFSCANYFYKKAKQYFSPCPKLPRLETLWENLETRWIRNTAYLFCKSCFARRESKGGGVSPLLSALLIYPLSISCSVFTTRVNGEIWLGLPQAV